MGPVSLASVLLLTDLNLVLLPPLQIPMAKLLLSISILPAAPYSPLQTFSFFPAALRNPKG